MSSLYSKSAPVDPGTRVSARRRSEGIISRVASLFENDRKKETKQKNRKQKKTLMIVLVVETLGFARNCRSVTFRCRYHRIEIYRGSRWPWMSG